LAYGGGVSVGAQKHLDGISVSNGYSTWEQVSGYFDGDGGIRIGMGMFTIQILVLWSDTDLKQIQHVADFLTSKGIRSEGHYLRRGKGKSNDAYNLAVSVDGGALAVLNGMLPFVDKKGRPGKSCD
jgi:hypothetical protein